MPTNLTKIAKDKLVHGVNKPTQHDHFIAVNNALRELYLIDKKSFYAANAIRKNWQFVPMDCMPETPIVTLNKTRIIQVKEYYWEDEEYETYDPNTFTCTIENGGLFTPAGAGWNRMGSAPDLLPSFVADWEGGGPGFNIAGEEGSYSTSFKNPFWGPNWEIDLSRWFYDTMSFPPPGPTAGGSSSMGADVDHIHAVRFMRTEGWPPSESKDPPECLGFVIVSAGFKPQFSAQTSRIAEYILRATFEKVTLTRPVRKWRWVDKEVPYIEYEVPPIINDDPTEWSFKVSDLVGENEILTEFLAATESSGNASGMFLVGYDTDPNIIISVNTRLGERLDTPDQKYYSDSRRAYMTKIPVPTGTEIVNIRYIKNRPPEEKTYGRILGYSKCKNVKAIIDSIIEVRPKMQGLTFGVTAKNNLTTLSSSPTGIFATDSTNTDDSMKVTATAAFILPYDAERFGHIHVLGSMYAGRVDNSIKWVDFDKPLTKANYGNFHIEKFDYRDVNNNLYYIWNLIVSKYNGGPGEVYAGIRNVRIQYR